MEINVIAELIPTNKDRKDKNYWICAWRLNNSIKKITELSGMFAEGRIYTDNSVCAVIDGINWRK